MDSVRPEANYRRPLAESAWRLSVVLVVGGFAFVATAVCSGIFNRVVLHMPWPTVIFLSLGFGGGNAYVLARGALQYIDRPVKREGKIE